MTSPVRKGPQLCEGETTYLGVFKVFNFFNHIYGGGGAVHTSSLPAEVRRVSGSREAKLQAVVSCLV